MSFKGEIVDCLSQQLSEIELLKSMYPNPGDIILSNSDLAEINNFLDSKSEFVPSNLDFVINLVINEMKLEVCVNLPISYPIEEPDIYIRCNQLNRQQETKLNSELSEYAKSNHIGEVCVYTVITWLQDNVESFTSSTEEESVKSNLPQEEIKFCRMWIYSHHICNKKKKEDIVKLAKEYDLTGFMLSGKPGVVCIEGIHTDCEQWWKIVKSMSWKKITVRKTEVMEYTEEENQRTFRYFKELVFKSQNQQSPMRNFSKFMMEHGFSQIFNEFFGFDLE